MAITLSWKVFYMKTILMFVVLGCALSGCSFLRTHKADIEQGNVITLNQVSHLRQGMTETDVKRIMGSPVLINLFSSNRLDYVYTFQPGYGQIEKKRVICLFQNGRLRGIKTS